MTEMPITRLVPVTLTPEEVRTHGETMARLERRYEAAALAAKKAAKDAKDALADLREDILDLAGRIERRQELREVPCQEQPDFARQIVCLVRTDTGEVVEHRPMTLTDHQLTIWERATEGDRDAAVPPQ
jgi:hypothetical protein